MKKLSLITLLISLFIITGCVKKQYQSPLFDAKFAEESQAVKDLLISQFPKPPSGFKWIMFQGVALRQPIHWSQYKTNKVYTSSIESVAKNGTFETGLTIQRVSNIKKITNISSLKYIVDYVKIFEADKNNKTLKLSFGGTKEGATIIYKYRNTLPNLKPVIVYKYLLANEKDDYAVIITIESTEKKWNKIWKDYGLVIFNKISVLPY